MRRSLLFIGWCCFALTSCVVGLADDVTPISSAHAHNDYYHQRPLLDALSNGFCSVEADVYLVEGKLLVGHDRDELAPNRTLQGLYLEPLRQRARQHDGRIYSNGPTFTLLVDFKSEGVATYRALDKVLQAYGDVLSSCEDERVTQRAIQLVVSGNRPIDLMSAQAKRYAFVDGRLSDLDGSLGPDLMPLISDRWTAHFRWRGDGDLSAAEQEKLQAIVRKTHQREQRLRFWATPDRPEVWQTLFDARVDLINTDDLPGLAAFLRDVAAR